MYGQTKGQKTNSKVAYLCLLVSGRCRGGSAKHGEAVKLRVRPTANQGHRAWPTAPLVRYVNRSGIRLNRGDSATDLTHAQRIRDQLISSTLRQGKQVPRPGLDVCCLVSYLVRYASPCCDRGPARCGCAISLECNIYKPIT
ncbi:hypothetical protein BT67DRAFT_219218 [Trichocladium antarcticum]|uniref:Uncharacterized protein n=1 Tax=Trichocladium antarcticum TaxID=1450529 RepID=A0AAN6UCE9_9PEZI|nr:hypothetical protein BT67DRAFT_219218 [Trichocladium antarcticum]